MSTLRTFNLQNPDSGTVNIEMDQGGNTLMTGIATVRGAAHFTSTSGSDAVGIGTDITAYKLDIRVTGAEAGLRVYNPDTSSNASGILRLGNDDNQNSAFLMLNGANNSSSVGGAANLVLGTGTSRQVHLATSGTSRFAVRSDGKISAGTLLDTNNGYEFSIRGADGTGCLYAHGRNHYLSTRSTSHASLTLKKSNSDSDGIDYLQLRDSSNTGKFIINGDGTLQIVDSINHLGDTNTKIRFPAADTFTVETSGSERLRVDANGRVLINSTSNPTIGGQTPYLYVSSYTNLDGLRIRGLDTGNTIWKTGGDMSLSVGSNDAINLKTNGTTRFVLNANSNNSTTLSIGNGNNLTNNTSPDRTSVKVGGTLHLEASFAGSNHKTGMYYNCHASGQSNFYQGSFGANSFDYRAAAATMNHGAFKVYTDPGTSTNYSAGAQITTMKETLTCANGFVTAPNQPCFWATSNTGGSDTSNGYTGIISNQFEAAYVNVGNHYNTSTGVFTCPVAGTYEFHGQGLVRHQSGVGRAELSFYKNGSNTISRSYGYTYITGTSDHDNLHVMAYITCAANDQIDFRVYACDSGIDVYWGQGLGYFAGRLVQ